MTPIDPRILTAGLRVSLHTLVTVYADHWRGIPARSVCPACGHRYPPDNDRAQCPTTALVRPLLRRRRNENPAALHRLTPDQRVDLTGRHRPALAHRQPYQPATHAALFDGEDQPS